MDKGTPPAIEMDTFGFDKLMMLNGRIEDACREVYGRKVSRIT